MLLLPDMECETLTSSGSEGYSSMVPEYSLSLGTPKTELDDLQYNNKKVHFDEGILGCVVGHYVYVLF